MDLAWVLLIQIRSLAFILGSPVSGSFSLFFCSPYSMHFLLLILHCFSLCSLFFSLSFLFFSRGDEDVAILEGGTCDRVNLPRPREPS